MIKTWPCKTDRCSGTYSAEMSSAAPAEWTEDDWTAFLDAQSAHVAAHPESLKVGMAPDTVRRNRPYGRR